VTLAFPTAARLSAAEIAGQLVCVALRDYRGDPASREAFLSSLDRRAWGGVIVFGGDLAATADLLAEARERSPIPPLVTGDFERGLGQQFPGAGTRFPSYMAFGAAGDPSLARAAWREIGRELAAAGFHVDFMPVADLALEPANPIVADRAASDDPELAAAIVAATVQGLQAAGVAATVKHFPGHGRTTVDSHEALPVVEASREELEASDWIPFRAGIAAGAKLAMSAHVAFPALEPDGARDRPATFSPALATGLLRHEWGFEGLLCSDALMMGAVTGESPAVAARRALEAGVDWLLYPPEPERVHAELSAALEAEPKLRSTCEQAADRLLTLKRWAIGGAASAGASARSAAASGGAPIAIATSAAPLAEAVAGAAIVADPPAPPTGPAWPDRAQWVVVLDGGIGRDEIVLQEELAPSAAKELLVVDTSTGSDAVVAAIATVREKCVRAWVACAVFSPVRAWKGRAGLSAAAREAIRVATADASEAVLIVFSNPRIVNELQAPPCVVWTHGEAPASQRAAIDFLRGSLPSLGRLPVRLNANR
jgi:beta-glucosidase-like glycosyl hydrolase